MRTLLRYLLISGLVLGLAVGAFVVRVGGRTVYGHLRSASQGKFDSVLAQIKAELDQRLDELGKETKSPSVKRKRPVEKDAGKPNKKDPREETVEKLRQAVKSDAGKRAPRKLAAKKSTVVDDPITDADEKALDQLLSQRLDL